MDTSSLIQSATLSATPATSAPHGRACTACARAKAKCISNDRSAKCERCLRLKKDCQLQPTTARRRANNKTATSKNARLEQKLDGLVSLLKSAAQSQNPLVDQINDNASVLSTQIDTTSTSSRSLVPSPETSGPSSHHTSSTRDLQRIDNVYTLGDASGHPPVPPPATTHGHSSPTSSYTTTEPSLAQVNQAVETFRSQMLPHFPCLVLPPSWNSCELRAQRPFLWLCIVAVSSKTMNHQIALAREVRETIARRIILEGEKNLDLLWGLLVFAAWSPHCGFKVPIFTRVVQLAVAILYDLNLNKMPPKESTAIMLEYNAQGCPKPQVPSIRTMEERRVAIGCYSVSQMISSFLQKGDALRWSPYFDECLRELSENRAEPTDSFLAYSVRLQLLAEKVAQCPWNEAATDTADPLRAPPVFYMKALEKQLMDLKGSIPPDLAGNEILLLQFYSVSLSIHEIALSKTASHVDVPEFQRLDSLWVCLDATKNWFYLFLQYPNTHCVGLSFSILSQMAHSIVALYRLSTFEHTEWDLNLVQQTCNFSLVLDQLMTKFTEAREVAGHGPGGPESHDIFSLTHRRLSHMKNWWDAKAAPTSAIAGQVAPAVEETSAEISMDFLDDAWLSSSFGLGDYQFDQYMQ